MTLFGQLAWMELRQQLRSHVFWIVFTVSLLMVIGAAAIDALRLVAAASLGSGAGLILRVHLIWTLFYLFTAAAFVADAVIRDDQTRFAPLAQATPVPRRTYVYARFTGAFGAVCACFLSVPLALLAARLLPGADPAWAPPLLPGAYAFALGLVALPNLFVASALFFALATATRSLTGCFLGAVALLTLYGLQQDGAAPGTLVQLLEPFSFAATGQAAAGVSQVLVANRLLWLGIAVLLLWVGERLYRRAPRSASRPRASETNDQPGPAAAGHAVVAPRFGSATVVVQLGYRVAFELRQTMFTLPFAALLLLGVAGAAASLWDPARAGADTRTLLVQLVESFQLVPAVVALFFAGELFWSEQAHRMDGLIGAAPVPPWLLVLAKFIALALLLASLAVATAAALAGMQLMATRTPDLRMLAGAYILPKSFDWILFGALALFLQAVSPGKLAGWGLLVLYMIAGLALDQAGLDDPLYRYASYPGAPLPPALSGAEGVGAYRLLWGGAALALLCTALLIAGRTGRMAGGRPQGADRKRRISA